LLDEFTKQTGIKVNWVNIGWDDLQTKIAAAMTANTYFADVADVDWSKVGEYQKTGWFDPLNKYFNVTSLGSDMPQLNTFVSDNELMAVPFDSSFLVTTVNSKDFAKAGITTMPTTLAGFTTALQKVGKANGIASPLDIQFATAEGLSTCWYQTTAAFGGQVLTAQDTPAFTSPSSPGYQALTWMVSAYKSGLVPKANINTTDYAGFTTEEAKNRTAAVKFINWFTSTENQAVWAGLKGPNDVVSTFPLPARLSSFDLLAKAGDIAQAAQLEAILKAHAQAPFPNGAPPWYVQFSAAVQTNIHEAAAGQETVAQAVSAIAAQVSQLEA
jgi:multiple sugar transport system substrate-binding protein